jgi:hypothetical protein
MTLPTLVETDGETIKYRRNGEIHCITVGDTVCSRHEGELTYKGRCENILEFAYPDGSRMTEFLITVERALLAGNVEHNP